ncbi:DegT/DnrJ/EryC1/StrS family aminotransferase [Hymenobacter latericus]|uniref:DegT/DnrJ/EryC1/StrS family aminotransferase n=1 Tax=Hymenobacter sp. YIM 151858-1 TaxID=2987688 RepID=UPI00222653CF|nr:DegT/DnrJ/EryC1/StrS family aminotransferase [Hymenobacter sp. YIM 151858-1]UYZ60596.1 DegT/DnrJ/EryC1/StrS family aminotransferase [Hymenobacter sp. YIM 151858-1]
MPPVPIRLLDLPAQHAPIQAELDAALHRVMQAGDFIQGTEVQLFADELGAYLGGAHVVPCANGTDALQLALMSLGLHPGDEVIVPAFTYVASAEAVAVLGLKPVLADVLPDTFTLDAAAAAAAITPRTRAVMAVHLYGQCADLNALQQLCRQHGLALIEDNAQAIGATWQLPDGRRAPAGTVGEVGTTSFFPSKNLGAMGDGGALLTADATRAAQLYELANHGQRRGQKYVHHRIGLNSRLDTLQAAVLRAKLPHLGPWTAARQRVATAYDAALAGLAGLQVPARQSGSTHVFHQYTIRLENPARRDALQQHLRQHGVPSVVYYPVPLHLQPAYQYLGHGPGAFPVAEQLCATVLSLPIHPTLTPEQVRYVSAAVQAWAQA